MPIRRFIIEPPRDRSEESIREAAEKLFAALKGQDVDQPSEMPLEPPGPVKDISEEDSDAASVDAEK